MRREGFGEGDLRPGLDDHRWGWVEDLPDRDPLGRA
jgi:hypothetical protein